MAACSESIQNVYISALYVHMEQQAVIALVLLCAQQNILHFYAKNLTIRN